MPTRVLVVLLAGFPTDMRYIAKCLSQLVLVLSALLAGEWSLFDLLNLVQPDGTIILGPIHGPKAHVELAFRFFLVIFAVALIVAADIVDIYLPRRELRRFRSAYLAGQCKIWRESIFAKRKIRIGVMYIRRRWFWPFWKVFHWAWSDGFEPPYGHHDVNMGLACWQGVVGQAFKTQVPKIAFFTGPAVSLSFTERWCFRNQFRFSAFQLRRTRGVRGIISIPIMRKGQGDSPAYKVVGVITLDAYTDDDATFLNQNEQVLVEYFFRVGSILGSLDM